MLHGYWRAKWWFKKKKTWLIVIFSCLQCSLLLCHCCGGLSVGCVKVCLSVYGFCLQEKLAKSIHYLISKEDQVRTQITELELLISQTQVRKLTHVAATQTILLFKIWFIKHKWDWVRLTKLQTMLQYNSLLFSCVDEATICCKMGDCEEEELPLPYETSLPSLKSCGQILGQRNLLWGNKPKNNNNKS